MIERFHRQLKTAIKCSTNHLWIDALPLVLLGIRAAVKEDLKCSTAEMVYGATLRLPGELIIPTHSDALRDPLSYVDTLKDLMHKLQYHNNHDRPPIALHSFPLISIRALTSTFEMMLSNHHYTPHIKARSKFLNAERDISLLPELLIEQIQSASIV